MAKVLICDTVADSAIQAIEKGGHQVTVKTGMDQNALLETVPGYDAMVVRSATTVRVPVLEHCKNTLKLVVRGGVGLDNIDVDEAEARGIAVRNTPSASSVAVAELAMGHMLACCRYIPVADRTMKQGKWNKKDYSKGLELWHGTLGLIGFGRIAREVAKRAKAFEMDVIFYDPFIEEESLDGAQKVTLSELCERANFISLHIPHSDETHYILDKPQFDLMQKDVVIVNCARGGTINEKALLQAIESGKVFAAGTDVFEKEPSTSENCSLVKSDKVIATPHIGAGSRGASARVGGEVAQIIIDFFK
jgi:D-3-phosphoglycerate dehydrogenase